MEQALISARVAAQKRFFATHQTLPFHYRKRALLRLRKAIFENQDRICRALSLDLGKSETESYMCEIGMMLVEIDHMCKNLKKYMRTKKVKTPLAQFSAKSCRIPCPYGTVLIMSPWNYPFLLSLEPLVDALAAGNTAILKPSAYSPNTGALIEELLGDLFPPEYVAVINGGREENKYLLDEAFDYIFFTGSKAVGREVMAKAAFHLTPVTLELGGKSPCIVDATAKLPLAAKRIVFGKFLNCGQTCVAPDYILCDAKIKDTLITYIIKEIKAQFGEAPLDDPHYGKIINRKHFDRIIGLIDKDKVIFGGEYDAEACRIAPTVMDDVTQNAPVMGEEIFGPILPILSYTDIIEAEEFVSSHERPLALYLFSEDKQTIARIMRRCRFGGGCINDVIIHLATSEMGFGGVGESGMGEYHGKAGFDTFTHYKSIVDKKTWIDLPMRYQPYTEKNLAKIKKYMK